MFGVRQRSARGRGSARGRAGNLGVGVVVLAVSMFGLAVPAGATNAAFISRFASVSTLATTVPANGDVNPYGIVVVPRTAGGLTAGHVLVSNFNASSNAQGTGTTIVDIAPGGTQRLFAQIDPKALPGPCPGGVGLTTALTVLPGGWVVVGSLPTTDGSSATAKAGCLIVLDSRGHVVETWVSPLINGPWDLTSMPTPFGAVLFVTNVLNGTVAANGDTVHRGTVVRIVVDIDPGRVPRARFMSVVANGLAERTDAAALVVGPTGVALAPDGTLYVADTATNRVAAVPNALFRSFPSHGGETVSTNGALNAPLGLTLAPNGNILTANGGDGNLVETTPRGSQVAVKQLDISGTPPGAGALFGLVVAPRAQGVLFVDDATNTLNLFR
jgi:NHL repeat